MKFEDINVNKSIEHAETLLEKEKNLSPALKSAIAILILLVKILVNRLGLNSKNSSKPPSSDKYRERGTKKKKTGKKQGGQNGHEGSRLEKTDSPDEIKFIKLDRRTLPRGKYRDVGYESRQVVDIKISRVVTEYRAQVLEGSSGKQFTAKFPANVSSDIQYGLNLKAHSVYMSQFQLIPYGRIQDYFREQMHTPLSSGTIFNFNKEAYDRLEEFEKITKSNLSESTLLHVDETGINVDKKNTWLHCASNELWVHFHAHEKRGKEAMDAAGILPVFTGTLCHDHWKPYYTYTCTHSLCNAHHLRELERAVEQDKQKWAENMQTLLLEIKSAVQDSNASKLSKKEATVFRKKYRDIITAGEIECPPPTKEEPKKRGRLKRSKSRNLLERLDKFEDDVLRFMENTEVPFTNNQGENDLRMTKVQQKISGCFRSLEGAHMFCRIRGYILTCQRHGMKVTDALSLLFRGELPDFAKIS